MMAGAYVESPGPKELSQIYTSETCQEVQRLLAFLLLHFRSSLITLNKYKKTPVGTHIATFDRAAYRLVASGLILHGLAYSSFMEEHISRLQLHDPPPLPSNCGQTPQDTNQENDDVEDEIADIIQELNLLQQRDPVDGRPFGIEESSNSGRWLRVLCGTFESIENILGAVSLISSPISIKLIAATSPPQSMHKWQDVVTSAFTDLPSSPVTFPSLTAPLLDSTTAFPSSSAIFPGSSIAFPPETVPSTLPAPCTDQDAINIIDKIMKSLRKEFFFSGAIHCEATLAGLMLSGEIPVSFLTNNYSKSFH
jgi:hypothetical protein